MRNEPNVVFMEVGLSFNIPDKPDSITQQQYETTLVCLVLDSVIDKVVLNFMDDHDFDAATVAASTLSTLGGSLATNAYLCGVSKEDVLEKIGLAYDNAIIENSSDHDRGNA